MIYNTCIFLKSYNIFVQFQLYRASYDIQYNMCCYKNGTFMLSYFFVYFHLLTAESCAFIMTFPYVDIYLIPGIAFHLFFFSVMVRTDARTGQVRVSFLGKIPEVGKQMDWWLLVEGGHGEWYINTTRQS
jgi:hypothetical protein